MRRNGLTIAGIVAGIVFAVGYIAINLIPGLGGTSKTKDFTDFYNSDSKRVLATVLGLVLVVGCWLMVWLFTELRGRLAVSVRTDVAYRLSLVAAAVVTVGTAVELGPTNVQNNQDNSHFVGVAIAHSFAQAGAGAVILGMLTFAAAVFLNGLELRRSTALPRWLGTLSIVFAILLISTYFVIPGFLFPIWAIIVGVAGRPRETPGMQERPATAPVSMPS
ncbi:MAG: hypothetical protein JWL73_686 [Actinomycetia bacterium]|nr:hypothetical protein [Actinomycetes bacterium]